MIELSQILAIIISAIMFVAIVSGKIHRYIPTLVGAALVIIVVFLGIMKSPAAVFSVLNLEKLGEFKFWVSGHEQIESHGVNWQTIIFIGGMMVMVEGLGEVGFFRWLCLYVARMVNYKAVPILITFRLFQSEVQLTWWGQRLLRGKAIPVVGEGSVNVQFQ